MWDVDDSLLNGRFAHKWTEEQKKHMLKDVATQRAFEARCKEAVLVRYMPNSLEKFTEDPSVIQKELYEYYSMSRAVYPSSYNKFLFTSNDCFISFDAFKQIETIAPRPLLLIIGSIDNPSGFQQHTWIRDCIQLPVAE